MPRISGEERSRIAHAANQEQSGPKLSATSSKDDLHKWLEARFEDWDREYEGGYTFDRLWGEVQSAVEATVHSNGRMRESQLVIPGWSIGYNSEISAHAATRSLPGDLLLVMTTPEDRAPRSLDEEVTVGLYHFDGDEWERVGFQDFPSVSSVIRMSDDQIKRVVRQ